MRKKLKKWRPRWWTCFGETQTNRLSIVALDNEFIGERKRGPGMNHSCIDVFTYLLSDMHFLTKDGTVRTSWHSRLEDIRKSTHYSIRFLATKRINLISSLMSNSSECSQPLYFNFYDPSQPWWNSTKSTVYDQQGCQRWTKTKKEFENISRIDVDQLDTGGKRVHVQIVRNIDENTWLPNRRTIADRWELPWNRILPTRLFRCQTCHH